MTLMDKAKMAAKRPGYKKRHQQEQAERGDSMVRVYLDHNETTDWGGWEGRANWRNWAGTSAASTSSNWPSKYDPDPSSNGNTTLLAHRPSLFPCSFSGRVAAFAISAVPDAPT